MQQYIQQLIKLPTSPKVFFSTLNLAAFGFCLGSHSIITPQTSGLSQLFTSAIKMPVLLITSTIVSFILVALLNLLLRTGFRTVSIAQAAVTCLLFTSIILIPFGLIILLLTTWENYSLIILTSYAGLSMAGLIGVGAFAYVLNARHRSSWDRRPLAIAAVWLVCFGVTSAELGWRFRPIVGWSGQTFAVFRHDDTGMFQQLRCEVRNTLNLGGVKLPKAGEESDTKDWPC